jgi:hypothetical protein
LGKWTKKLLTGAVGAAILALGAAAAQAGTLDDVKAKGFVQCGVNGANLAGFGAQDSVRQLVGPRRRSLPCGCRGGLDFFNNCIDSIFCNDLLYKLFCLFAFCTTSSKILMICI